MILNITSYILRKLIRYKKWSLAFRLISFRKNHSAKLRERIENKKYK